MEVVLLFIGITQHGIVSHAEEGPARIIQLKHEDHIGCGDIIINIDVCNSPGNILFLPHAPRHKSGCHSTLVTGCLKRWLKIRPRCPLPAHHSTTGAALSGHCWHKASICCNLRPAIPFSSQKGKAAVVRCAAAAVSPGRENSAGKNSTKYCCCRALLWSISLICVSSSASKQRFSGAFCHGSCGQLKGNSCQY